MTEPRRLGRPSRRSRSVSRTIPLPGDGGEYGNWYACWFCGMHCNDVTDFLDDGASKMHTTYQDFTTVSTLQRGVQLRLGDPTFFQRNTYVVKRGADGNHQTVVHLRKIVDTKGCPGCGNLNWRGDY